MKKNWSLFLLVAVIAVLVLGACASTGSSGGGGVSGSASASANGYGGPISVTVTVENGKIVSVEADGPAETQGIGSRAVANLPGAIVAANSVNVDGVSGATVSSQALLKAAQEAYSKIGN